MWEGLNSWGQGACGLTVLESLDLHGSGRLGGMHTVAVPSTVSQYPGGTAVLGWSNSVLGPRPRLWEACCAHTASGCTEPFAWEWEMDTWAFPRAGSAPGMCSLPSCGFFGRKIPWGFSVLKGTARWPFSYKEISFLRASAALPDGGFDNFEYQTLVCVISCMNRLTFWGQSETFERTLPISRTVFLEEHLLSPLTFCVGDTPPFSSLFLSLHWRYTKIIGIHKNWETLVVRKLQHGGHGVREGDHHCCMSRHSGGWQLLLKEPPTCALGRALF